MSDELSFAEIDGMSADALPPRTVLSVLGYKGGGGGSFGGGGGNTFSGCENGMVPNQAVGILGLGAGAGFVSNGCTSGADIH